MARTDWIDLGDIALRFRLEGTGSSVLVLVHEMGGTLESWDHVLPALLPGRRVLRYDTRGAGQSEKARGTLDFATMANDLAKLLDALDISGRVTLAGCAVGAGTALQFAAHFPDRVAALVAMAPATGVDPARRAAALERAAQTEERGMRAVLEESFSRSYPPETRHDAEHFRTYRARWLANDPHSYAAIYRMLATADMRSNLARISCPVLVLAGTQDRLRPPTLVEAVAVAIPEARFAAIKSGHFMATQTPVLVARHINEFLTLLGL